MGGKSNLCKDQSGAHYSSNVVLSLTMPFLFPCYVCFSAHFMRKLINERTMPWSDTRMTSAVSYLVCTLLAFIVTLWRYDIDPILQKHHSRSLEVCQCLWFFGWGFGALAYVPQIRVYICRLRKVFDGSIYEMSHKVEPVFLTCCILTLVPMAFALATLTALIDCGIDSGMSFLSRIPIFPSSVVYCYSPEKLSV